jgi:hypothetical protein
MADFIYFDLLNMTDQQLIDLRERGYFVFRGKSYEYALAINQMFSEELIMEGEEAIWHDPPISLVRPVGKLVMQRLIELRDRYGILPSEEVIIEVFQKAQGELVKGKRVSDGEIAVG